MGAAARSERVRGKRSGKWREAHRRRPLQTAARPGVMPTSAPPAPPNSLPAAILIRGVRSHAGLDPHPVLYLRGPFPVHRHRPLVCSYPGRLFDILADNLIEIDIRALFDQVWSQLQRRAAAGAAAKQTVPEWGGGGGAIPGRISVSRILCELFVRNLFGVSQHLHRDALGCAFAHGYHAEGFGE